MGTGLIAGNITEYYGGYQFINGAWVQVTGLDIAFSKEWMQQNLPAAAITGTAYNIKVSGLTGGGSASFSFKLLNDNLYTNPAATPVTDFGGADRYNPTDSGVPLGAYPSVFSVDAPNRPWHDGKLDVSWPYE